MTTKTSWTIILQTFQPRRQGGEVGEDLGGAGLGELGLGVGGGDADDLTDTGGDGGAYAGRGVLGRERGGGVDAEAFAGQPVAGGVRLAVDHIGRRDDEVDPLGRSERAVDRRGSSSPGRRR